MRWEDGDEDGELWKLAEFLYWREEFLESTALIELVRFEIKIFLRARLLGRKMTRPKDRQSTNSEDLLSKDTERRSQGNNFHLQDRWDIIIEDIERILSLSIEIVP